jgi:Carboxypeptidase regulatory-like domain
MRMRRIALAITIGCLSGSVLSAQSDGGRIAGRITDASGTVLPGVTIVVTAPNLRITATADNAGRFEVTGLRPGLYLIKTELPGFKALTREVTLTASASATADFILVLDPCQISPVYVIANATDLWRHSSLAAVFRVHEPPATINDICGPASQYAAGLIRNFRNPSFTGVTTATIAVVTNLNLSAAKEYVAWLRWDARIDAFRIVFNADVAMVVPVVNGRFRWPRLDLGLYPLLTVEEFFDEAAGLSQQPVGK